MRISSLLFGSMIGMLIVSVAIAGEHTEGAERVAKRLYREGMTLARDGNCETAASKFEAAMAAFPNKGSLYNLAICYDKLEKYRDAIVAFKKLFVDFGSELKEEMKKSAEEKQRAIEKRFAWVTVSVDHPGVDVLFDGEKQGTTPLGAPLLTQKETIEVVLVKKGYKPWSKSMPLKKGMETTVEAVLTPADGQLNIVFPLSGATVSVGGKPMGITPMQSALTLPPGRYRVTISHPTIESIGRTATIEPEALSVINIDKSVLVAKTAPAKDENSDRANAAATPGDVDRQDAAVPATRQRVFRISGLTAIGVGVAGVVAGAITGGIALGIDKDLDQKCPKGECPASVNYVHDQDRMNHLGTASTVLLATGGVVAAAGIALTVLSYRLNFNESRAISVLPWGTPDATGTALQFRF